MRVIHSSDWHLGHVLKGEVTREHEHQAFLDWLLGTCMAEMADALVITGDVFDSATPPASAERMWFAFLAAARRAMPRMDVIAIAGNHDSPARLGAASPVLRELGMHVIGAIGADDVVIPIAGGRGLVAAVPFLRPIDLPDGDDPLEAVYARVIAAARAKRAPEQALIVTGHLYLAGANTQYLSERRVSIGGIEAAPVRLFPEDISYVALGHIHRGQRVGRDTIRYAGAPIPLALDEAAYKNQVLAIEFDGPRVVEIRALPVPRAVEIVRIAGTLAEVLPQLAVLPELPRDSSQLGLFAVPAVRPYLEVVVELQQPEPRLRAIIDKALEGKLPRLVCLRAEATGDRAALGDRITARRLAELDPRDVFARLWARDHAEPPSAEVRAAFDRLVEEVRGDREDLAS
jgi:exonuclease SbcD